MKLKELFEATGKSVADLGIDYKGGDFQCSNQQLAALSGCPEHVSGDFDCGHNRLKALSDGPRTVQSNYYCNDNQIKSLNGVPREINGDFVCSFNDLTSLAGCPEKVKGDFVCSFNSDIKSLKNIHMHIERISGHFYGVGCSIESNVLGLMLIKDLKFVGLSNYDKTVEEILNRHLGKGRAGMLMAQEELIEAGLEEYAQL
jgi:hypothetical protein